MSIFSKMADILNSNINSILDKAQDPVKISKMMIREIEDTIIENKSSLGRDMMERKQLERQRNELRDSLDNYEQKAELTIENGNEGLARKILEQTVVIDKEIQKLNQTLQQREEQEMIQKNDIIKMESKLSEIKSKLQDAQSKASASSSANDSKQDAQSDLDSKFNKLENQLESIEASKGTHSTASGSLDAEIEAFERDTLVEEKLKQLRAKKNL